MPLVPPGNKADCQRQSRSSSNGRSNPKDASCITSMSPSTSRLKGALRGDSMPSFRSTDDCTEAGFSASPSMAAVDIASRTNAAPVISAAWFKPMAPARPITSPWRLRAARRAENTAGALAVRFGQFGRCQRRGLVLRMSRIVANTAQFVSRKAYFVAHRLRCGLAATNQESNHRVSIGAGFKAISGQRPRQC